MMTTLLISFREFLEAFLIIGVFLGISRNLKLNREKEIIFAALFGMVVALLLPTGAYLLGDRVKSVLTEKNADILQGYLMVFSGFFIAYVVFSLHRFFSQSRTTSLARAREKITGGGFDLALFFTVALFIVREGFEVALFTATTSLLSAFRENIIGLLLGFAASSAAGLLTFFAYIKLPIKKLFKFTEYLIVILGAALVKNGLTTMLDIHFNINLSNILPLHLNFLPDHETSFVGHALNNLFGIESELSIAKIAVMALYVVAVYFLLVKNPKKEKAL